MATRFWKPLTTGSYFNNSSWLNGAPAAGDIAVIDGSAASAPVRLGGTLQLGSIDDSVALYQPGTVPNLIADPPYSAIPKAPPVVGETIDSIGGAAIVGFTLINSTLATNVTMNVTGNAVFDANYTNTLAGAIQVAPTAGGPVNAAGYNGELDIVVEPIGSVDPNGRVFTGYTPTTTNTGNIDLGSGSHLVIDYNGAPPAFNNLGGIEQALGGLAAFVNAGEIGLFSASLDVEAGYAAFGRQYNSFVNNGVIQVVGQTRGASARFDAEVDGTGTVVVAGTGAATASAAFFGGVTNAVTVADGSATFTESNPLVSSVYAGSFAFKDGAAALTIDAPTAASGFMPIAGFAPGDTIQVNDTFVFTPDIYENNLIATPTVTWNQANGTLTVGYKNQDGAFSGTIGVLRLTGNYVQSQFSAVASAGTGYNSIGTAGYVPPHATIAVAACYGRGTRIMTDRGEVAIEALAIGDRLVTASGALRSLRWIGHRSYAGRFAAHNRQLWPVLICTSALADGIPQRDLYVSPAHAMFIGGLLIPAAALINGTSVRQVLPAGGVEYFHLELDEHEVIIAEGSLSESYVEDDNRGLFQNAASACARRFDARERTAAYCAPRRTDGEVVEAVRRQIAARSCSGTGLQQAG